MDITCALQIQTAIKALVEVIIPAVDPGNKLAQEQAGLVVGALKIVAQRMPLVYRYERDELARFLALARSLESEAAGRAEAGAEFRALADAARMGDDVLKRARAEPAEIEAANGELREKLGALVTQLYSGGAFGELKHVSAALLAHAKQQLIRERSWLIGQGWEADPAGVPSIETLIGNGAHAI